MFAARCAAAFGLLVVLGGGGCSAVGQCSCPPPPNEAVIHLGCLPVKPPVTNTTGACSACPAVLANGSIPAGARCAVARDSQDITLFASGAGVCHVQVTFGNGATSSVDLDFTSDWIACGSDPHGCGEGFVAATADGGRGYTLAVPAPLCEAGLEVDASRDGATDAPAHALEVDGSSDVAADASADAPEVDSPIETVSDAQGDAGCVPTTCESLGDTCSPQGDGCGNLVGPCKSGVQAPADAGSLCIPPEYCGGGGPNRCGGAVEPYVCGQDLCVPNTCAEIDCGVAGDGCGGVLECGACPLSGESCVDGACVWPSDAGPCVPATCEGLGYDCGVWSDGCGGHLDCGTCADSQFCGGGGAHRCGGTCATVDGGDPCAITCSADAGSGCTGQSCQGSGHTCGEWPNGCGGLVECGPCGGDAGTAGIEL